MKLIDAISSNNNLSFYDLKSKASYTFSDLLFPTDHLSPKERQIVLLYLDNSIESISMLFSFYNSDNCIILHNNKISEELKSAFEEKYQPWLIFDVTRAVVDGYENMVIKNDLQVFCKSNPVNVVIDKNIKVLLTTSGTTGSPKLVKLSDENLFQNAKSITEYLPINPSQKIPLNLPIYYSYGLSVLTSNCIAGGTIYTSVPEITDKNFWEYLSEFSFSTLAGVPYFYQMLDRLGFLKKRFPHLEYMTQAGGKLNNVILSKFKDYAITNNIRFFVMYGQTEATARMSYLDPGFLETKLGSIGKPIPGGTFNIDKDSSELIYSGPNVFGGYAESYSDLKSYEFQNQLRTGDIAEFDHDGFYFITGRLKRIIKLFGSRINLDEIEALLNDNIVSSKFVIIAKEDSQIIVFKSSEDTLDDDIKELLFVKYSIHPSVIKIFQLLETPVGFNGKIDYKKLSELYAG